MQQKNDHKVAKIIATLCAISMVASLLLGCSLAQTKTQRQIAEIGVDERQTHSEENDKWSQLKYFDEVNPRIEINSQQLFHLPSMAKTKTAFTAPIQEKLKVTLTAYTSKECRSVVTASNSRVRHGIVAVSKNLFKKGWTFGKQVLVDGHLYIIEDILPSRSNGLDVYFEKTADAREFGKKTLTVALLK